MNKVISNYVITHHPVNSILGARVSAQDGNKQITN